MDTSAPKILPIFALGNGVLLPHMVVPLPLETAEARAAVAAAQSAGGTLLVVSRLDGAYAPVGTVAEIVESGATPHGVAVVLVRGRERATIGPGVPGPGDALWVRYEPRPDPEISSPRSKELAREYRAIVEEILEARHLHDLGEYIRDIKEPGALADVTGHSPDLTIAQRIELLETFDVEARLEKVLVWAKEALADIDLRRKIHADVSESMTREQRQELLRRQLEAIRRELGELSGEESVADGYRRRIAHTDVPEAVRRELERELERLERTPEQAVDHGWIRAYLDWLVDVPWGVRTEDQLDIAHAKAVLDADHEGLKDVKERLLELLAVRNLRRERGFVLPTGRGAGAIITLVGPPGVGKTSLGESVARALGRRFARVSLGGIRDEAEIRGHRRTYVGAMPGRIVRGLKEAGSMNPVFMLDEIDKIGSDWRGDPSSALLEVLDPAQNHTFQDHYLEVPIDLSDVLFICTANVLDRVPGPLLDRMESIELDGYTDAEKLAIARNHLLARQLTLAGLRPEEVEISDSALARIVSEHTREAGVRGLEREIGKLLRKIATKIAARELIGPVQVKQEDVPQHLGPRRFHHDSAERTSVPGVATGLSVTATGGEVLFVEATRLQSAVGDGLTLTGQLGDVMKESARIAQSYVLSHADALGVPRGRSHGGFHVHVPVGAVPKDGPSAGLTIAVALVSLLSGRPIRSALGMTGEITLRGRVLAVGGIKQKLLAAHRAGLTQVVLPRRNEPDLAAVPPDVLSAIAVHLVDEIAPVIGLALEEPSGVGHGLPPGDRARRPPSRPTTP